MTREELYAAARALPATPGVYIMYNVADKVIYVGKSKALRNRVGSYFASYANHKGKTARMVASVHHFEVYHTATELEALVLENQFIKQYMPRYNIKLKDSTGYPYIRVSDDEYPRISLVTNRGGDGSYYGPYASHTTAKNIVSAATAAFSLPTCNRRFPSELGKSRPCLNFHIGRCIGFCSGKVSKQEYLARVDGVKRLLGGDCQGLAKELEQKMTDASEAMDFERAAAYRDSMRAVLKIRDKQHIVAATDTEADVFGIYADDAGSALTVLMIRGGAISDKETLFFGADEIITPSSLVSLMGRYYTLREFVPKEIWCGYDLGDEASVLEQSLKCTKILSPKRGEKRAIADRAETNAKEQLLHRRAENERQGTFLASLASFLQLEVVPQRIESYDVSNSGDDYITAGMVVLIDGKFCKRLYRSFNIKSSDGQDDYASTAEALRRRFSHLDEGEAWQAPDLILADGSSGQISAIRTVLDEYGLNIPVFGMVKDEHHKTRTLTDGENDISLNRRQDIFMFIYKLQEEVHRFSLSRMDLRRRHAVKHSVLTEINGVGKRKAEQLLLHFGGLKELRAASVDEIAAVKGVNRALAESIYSYLKENIK